MIFFMEINERILYLIDNKTNKNKRKFAKMKHGFLNPKKPIGMYIYMTLPIKRLLRNSTKE